MGFKIAPLIQGSMKETSRNALANKIVAIDAFNELYKFIGFSQNRPIGELMLAFLQRITALLGLRIKPIYAFEGCDEWARNFQDRRINRGSVSEQVINNCIQIVKYLGLPVVQAPWDGEAQAAHIVNAGDAFAVLSEDYDTLLFGAKIMMIKLVGIEQPLLIQLEDMLKELEVTQDQLIDASILAGNDYYKGVKGIGVKTALDIVKKHGSLETVDKFNLYVCGTHINLDMEEVNRVRSIFKSPSVKDSYKLEWIKPQYDAVRSFMIDAGSNPARVDETITRLKRLNLGKKQTAIDSFVV